MRIEPNFDELENYLTALEEADFDHLKVKPLSILNYRLSAKEQDMFSSVNDISDVPIEYFNNVKDEIKKTLICALEEYFPNSIERLPNGMIEVTDFEIASLITYMMIKEFGNLQRGLGKLQQQHVQKNIVDNIALKV